MYHLISDAHNEENMCRERGYIGKFFTHFSCKPKMTKNKICLKNGCYVPCLAPIYIELEECFHPELGDLLLWDFCQDYPDPQIPIQPAEVPGPTSPLHIPVHRFPQPHPTLEQNDSVSFISCPAPALPPLHNQHPYLCLARVLRYLNPSRTYDEHARQEAFCLGSPYGFR